MSNPRSVSETIALLDRLRRTVRDSVKRRDELERETTLRTNRLRAQHEQALAATRDRWTADTPQSPPTGRSPGGSGPR